MKVNFKNVHTALDSNNNPYDADIFYTILSRLKEEDCIEDGYKINMPENMNNECVYHFDLNSNNSYTFNNDPIKNLNFVIPNSINDKDKEIIIGNLDSYVPQKITVKKVNKKKIIENILTGVITAGMIAGMAYMLADSFMKEQELQEYENRTYVEELNREREKNGVEPIVARIK